MQKIYYSTTFLLTLIIDAKVAKTAINFLE